MFMNDLISNIEDLGIIKDFEIVEKYYSKMSVEKKEFFRRELEDITTLVIHGTGGGRAWTYLKRWMRTAGGRFNRGIGFYPFLIERKEKVIALHDLFLWFYHSGSGLFDKKTIGIELLNTKINRGEYTDFQYEKLFKIVDILIAICPNLKTITGHDYLKIKFGGKRKNCPGLKFDWNKIIGYIESKDINLKIIYEVEKGKWQTIQ